jgi:hypothetical protein
LDYSDGQNVGHSGPRIFGAMMQNVLGFIIDHVAAATPLELGLICAFVAMALSYRSVTDGK